MKTAAGGNRKPKRVTRREILLQYWRLRRALERLKQAEEARRVTSN